MSVAKFISTVLMLTGTVGVQMPRFAEQVISTDLADESPPGNIITAGDAIDLGDDRATSSRQLLSTSVEPTTSNNAASITSTVVVEISQSPKKNVEDGTVTITDASGSISGSSANTSAESPAKSTATTIESDGTSSTAIAQADETATDDATTKQTFFSTEELSTTVSTSESVESVAVESITATTTPEEDSTTRTRREFSSTTVKTTTPDLEEDSTTSPRPESSSTAVKTTAFGPASSTIGEAKTSSQITDTTVKTTTPDLEDSTTRPRPDSSSTAVKTTTFGPASSTIGETKTSSQITESTSSSTSTTAASRNATITPSRQAANKSLQDAVAIGKNVSETVPKRVGSDAGDELANPNETLPASAPLNATREASTSPGTWNETVHTDVDFYVKVNASMRNAASAALAAAEATNAAAAAAEAYREAKERAANYAKNAEDAVRIVESQSGRSSTASKESITVASERDWAAWDHSALKLVPEASLLQEPGLNVTMNMTESTLEARAAADVAVQAAENATNAMIGYRTAEHDAFVAAEAGLKASQLIEKEIQETVNFSLAGDASLAPPKAYVEHLLSATETTTESAAASSAELHSTTTESEGQTTSRETGGHGDRQDVWQIVGLVALAAILLLGLTAWFVTRPR